jgi:hypothetical protein
LPRAGLLCPLGAFSILQFTDHWPLATGH